ncbi:MAG: cysteine desulfurase-like protein [Acidobacteria bacterium]|nr:cysteine desulfurase-like protein [Acidobacteriota bacterium]
MPLDLAFARSQFPALSDDEGSWIYLDNAGGSQVLGPVADRVRDYLLTSSVQTGASYGVSALASERLYAGQLAVAELVNASRPEEIVFGPSSTVMIQTLARAITPALSPGDELVVSMIDHEANIGPWLALKAHGIVVRPWQLNRETMTLEVSDLELLMTPRTRLVVCTQTSNIFGQLIPIAAVTACAHRHGAVVCVDGVAFAPHRLVDVREWDVDYYVFSLYKVFGPHHAVLYGKYDRLLGLANLSHHFVPMDKIPGKLQPGNPNYELSYGATAIPEYLVALGERSGATAGASRRARMAAAFDAIADHESLLAERLLGWLRGRHDVRVIGPASSQRSVRVPTISFVVDGIDSERIVRAIDPLRIGIRFGDFYSRRLIEDLGLAAGHGVVRASFAHYNTVSDADRLIAGLEQALPRTRRKRSEVPRRKEPV